MVFEKIFLLWASSWRTFLSLSMTNWVSLILLFVYRFYSALLTTGVILLAVPLIAMNFFGPHIVFMLIWLSLVVYLMRPTIGLKNRDYSKRYFSLENMVCIAAYIFFFSAIALFLPQYLQGVIILLALVNYSFLYDYAATIPVRCVLSFIKSCYFILYKAPSIIGPVLVLCMLEYFGKNPFCIILNLSVLYPCLSALVTIIYIDAIHENYELYYAE